MIALEPEQKSVERWLGRAIAEFNTNPLCTGLIRRLAREYPDSFSDSAIRHLESPAQSSADRMITVLLVQGGSLFHRISDPLQSSRHRALKLFQRLLTADPSFDVKLARMLPDRSGVNHAEAYRGSRAERAIDILDETSRGRRLLPVLGHLVNSPDSSTCATATLFVGHRLKSPEWVGKQLERIDNRVRANAVESIWGLDTPPARQLLERFVNDRSNRVAGNSLVGLHIIGMQGIVDVVNGMVNDSRHEFRATAAWTMGRMLDPQFVPQLHKLMKDENSRIRSLALRSLLEIRLTAREEVAAQAEPQIVPVERRMEPEKSPHRKDEQIVFRQLRYSPLRLNLDGSSFAAGADD